MRETLGEEPPLVLPLRSRDRQQVPLLDGKKVSMLGVAFGKAMMPLCQVSALGQEYMVYLVSPSVTGALRVLAEPLSDL